MTGDVTIVHVVAALVIGLLAGAAIAVVVRRSRADPQRATRRIVLPFTGRALSRRVLDSAFRLAKAEDAVLVPVYLATVPQRRALEAPLPRECESALPLLDSIEQLGVRYGVQVESMIEKGRSPRHALQLLMAEETPDRVVVPASAKAATGFSASDVAWILEHVDGEVLVFRAGAEDEKVLASAA
jgi:Universal stress protein family